MYLGSRNKCCKYVMEKEGESVELERTSVEKDLGVYIDDDLKLSKHAETQVNKANKLLGLIRRSLTYLDLTSVSILYKALIRPVLEYCHSIVYPRFEKRQEVDLGSPKASNQDDHRTERSGVHR